MSCLVYRQAEWEQDKNTVLKIGKKQTSCPTQRKDHFLKDKPGNLNQGDIPWHHGYRYAPKSTPETYPEENCFCINDYLNIYSSYITLRIHLHNWINHNRGEEARMYTFWTSIAQNKLILLNNTLTNANIMVLGDVPFSQINEEWFFFFFFLC